MKKILIAISIIFIIVSIRIFHSSTKVKLFENIDIERVDQISISYIGGTFSTKDKSQISEIMNYLKNVQFSERSDNNAPNTTPDVLIGLSGKDNYDIPCLKIYGDLARVVPEQEHDYTIPDDFYREIESLCKKYKEANN
ncbi:hypothetical protein [Clostridium weizhouense]|uniref:Lipoprotein n=1 Tax=Clostridium weizhouense TaxID=2859781 RepID=A0ABS7APV2_9CLOT|nr:hypothetical protein [Clostridium weizhouense]MBW6410692.1 hypothetical protein [Clostridium weizhouense]